MPGGWGLERDVQPAVLARGPLRFVPGWAGRGAPSGPRRASGATTATTKSTDAATPTRRRLERRARTVRLTASGGGTAEGSPSGVRLRSERSFRSSSIVFTSRHDSKRGDARLSNVRNAGSLHPIAAAASLVDKSSR